MTSPSRSTSSSSANPERAPLATYPELTRFIDRQREYAELLVEVMSAAQRATEEGLPR